MVKCPHCDVEMKAGKDAYFDDNNDIIVIHDVFRCPSCGEIMLSSEQMKRFVGKLSALGSITVYEFSLLLTSYSSQ